MPSNPASHNSEKLQAILQNAQAFVLDFDGLIADSEPFHYKAYNAVFEKYGHTLDPEEYWVEFTSKGSGLKGEIERHNLKIDASPEEMRREKFEHYSRFCQSGEIKLFPEAARFVEALKTRFPIAVASGSWGHDIEAILENAGARDWFTTILGKEAAEREKPHPDIFINAARRLETPPEKCVVVEDALKGLVAAKKIGMACVIVRNRLNQNIDFSEADATCSSLEEITDALEMFFKK